MTAQLPSISIFDMPKRRKSVHQNQAQYRALCLLLQKIEVDLATIQRECPDKTSCYLRYGWEFAKPFEHSAPYDCGVGVDSWQHALADLYTNEANKLLKEREAILKKIYGLVSRHCELPFIHSHLRKPSFEVLT